MSGLRSSVLCLTVSLYVGGYHGRGRMVVPITTRFEFEPRSWRGVRDTTLCDKIFVSDLRQVGGVLRVHRFPPPIALTATI